MSAVIADEGWRAQVSTDGLVLHAGADLNYLVPDLPAEHARIVAAWFGEAARRPVEPDELPAALAVVVRELRSLGALRPAGLPTPATPARLSVAVRVAGETWPGLSDTLHTAFPPTAEPDLSLVVRTTATLRELAELAAELTGPHLLLDLAYHHTAALGPLVVPGGSACLACLALRAGLRWGDAPPPPRPGAAAAPALPVTLARHAVDRLGAGSLALLERCVSIHLDELTSTSEDVLPAAGCPVCPGLPTGPATLPWETP